MYVEVEPTVTVKTKKAWRFKSIIKYLKWLAKNLTHQKTLVNRKKNIFLGLAFYFFNENLNGHARSMHIFIKQFRGK